jgi:signal transduction histidine kinase
MRVRKKLVVLHTLFSILLGAILMTALRPAVRNVVLEAETEQALLVLDAARQDPRFMEAGQLPEDLASRGESRQSRGTSQEIGLDPRVAIAAINANGRPVKGSTSSLGPCAVMFDVARQGFVALTIQLPAARDQVRRLYLIVVGAVLAMYVLVALAIEALVLPQSVYRPIRRMLEADDAVQQGRKNAEMIPADAIPADELGEIMRSRNESVLKLRMQEQMLASALTQLEAVANDLKRKNHLLEAAQRNLADADRLASLGVMSAGVAHELNTPLSVIKGLTERLAERPGQGLSPEDAALMLRVVGRLEGLSESLLDYARVRPPRLELACLHQLVQEAMTLVSLDRDARDITLLNAVDPSLALRCDPDRIVQVLVNLVRNAVDAIGTHHTQTPMSVSVQGEPLQRDGRAWVSIRVSDTGPGLDPLVLARLFEPFVSTKLDSKGTGLGLAVAEGIAREHGGVLLAHNRTDGVRGATFELILPIEPEPQA